jgi:hypothetical protein
MSGITGQTVTLDELGLALEAEGLQRQLETIPTGVMGFDQAIAIVRRTPARTVLEAPADIPADPNLQSEFGRLLRSRVGMRDSGIAHFIRLHTEASKRCHKGLGAVPGSATSTSSQARQ